MIVDTRDLISSDQVAVVIGLTNRKGVSVLRARHADFPVPIIDNGMCMLWLRAEVVAWAKGRR